MQQSRCFDIGGSHIFCLTIRSRIVMTTIRHLVRFVAPMNVLEHQIPNWLRPLS